MKMALRYLCNLQRIRDLQGQGQGLDEAIPEAVGQCINDGILHDFLLKIKAEAMGMILTEFNEQEWEEEIREEAKEEARDKGIGILIKILREDGVDDARIRQRLIDYYGITSSAADEYLGIPAAAN